MYETYFNLNGRPFASVPKMEDYVPVSAIESARSTLARCIDRAEGAAMLIGPTGTGKTLLCQLLAEQFKGSFEVALLAGAHLNSRRGLLQAVLYELHRPYRDMDEGELRLALIDHVTLDEQCGRGIVLLVDEAHHLPLRLLDEVRSLTNLIRGGQPAVRLVLSGSRGLEERLASPRLESFSQRLAARCYIEALSREATEGYIHGRIAACGGQGPEIFPTESCRSVYKATDGVPRLINQVCDHVLLLAFAAGRSRIEPAHVEEAWADLQQLPTPWNEPVAKEASSVIEFGGLDDEPIDAGAPAMPAATPDEPVEQPGLRISPAIDAASDSPLDEQLSQIQQILTDVEEEFQPAGTIGPETELAFDDSAHPFSAPFTEEEVITDRYAKAHPAVQASVSPRPTAPAPVETPPAPVDEPHPQTVPLRSSPAFARATEPDDTDLIVVEDSYEDKPARPKITMPVVRRQEYARLFANLRRGS